jgi:hypothetical protein
VDLAEAQAADGLLVEAGAVAFVTGKGVAGIAGIHCAHEGIPGSLGQDRSASNAERELVAFDQGGLVPFELWENEVISEKVIRKKRGESREQRKVGREWIRE